MSEMAACDHTPELAALYSSDAYMDHPAKEVYVSGTFDDWAKSVQLDKKDGHFEKLVDLPYADKKIIYKFVVDGNWTTDHTAPQETDEASNVNNVLLPEDITKADKMTGGLGGATISGVTPGSTTTQLASRVPKEPTSRTRTESTTSDVPGTYPETPFHDAPEFTVNPIPATPGAGNPISLKPGEQVPPPSTITDNKLDSHVTLDKESYENSGRTVSQQAGDTQAGMFSVPPIGKGVIPESSVPMGTDVPSEKDIGPMIQSTGAGTSTAALAANVPKEPRGVPQVVFDSQHEAGVEPEASGNQEAVEEKTAMEKELESKVPEEPATSEGNTVGGTSGVQSSVQQSTDAKDKNGIPIAPTVPDIVQESITESHQSPEAAGNSNMVSEKAAVEEELLKEIKPTDAAGEPAPSSSAALTDTAPTPTTSKPDSEAVTTAAAPAQTPRTQNAMAQVVNEQRPESREISPMTRPTGQVQPIVTTGVSSSDTPGKSTSTDTGASPASKASAGTNTDKKSKRSSGFFGKIKEKLKR
ncbi:MAG: hypothetical protein Q9163_005503 [Psora crenata]